MHNEPCGGDGDVAATWLVVANLFNAQTCSVLFSPSTDASKTGGVFRALQIRMFYPPLVYLSVTIVCKLVIFH